MDSESCTFLFLTILGLAVGYAILDTLLNSRRVTIHFGRSQATDQRTWDKEQAYHGWTEYQSNERVRLGWRGRLKQFWRDHYSQDPPLWPLVQKLRNTWRHRTGQNDPDERDE